MKWISFVNLVLLLTFSASKGQEIEKFNFETISDNINNTILDSSGLYWIATSEGLNMFDGNKMHSFFSTLSQQNTILNNSIDNIIELDNLDLVFVSKDILRHMSNLEVGDELLLKRVVRHFNISMAG